MRLIELNVPNEGSDRRTLVQGLLGKEVILKDTHYSWLHGKILGEGSNSEVYSMNIASNRGKTSLHYHDLEVLLEVQRTQEDIDLTAKNT